MTTSILQWLDETAAAYPDKTAFIDSQGESTFAQFDQARKAIGTALCKTVPAGSPVVVMTGRHRLTPACFLGVVSAGCFYAPVDAAVPQQRIGQILGVIQADYLLTDRQNLAVAESSGFHGTILVMEELLDTPVEEARLKNAAAGLTGEAPLYVIFTSGSTGVPKGVVTSHYSLMCYIDAITEVLQVNSEDIFGGQSPLDYIAAVRDIYIPIRTGAATVILPKSEFSMPQRLFETLNRHRVTALCWSVAGVELPAKLGAFDIVKPEYLRKLCFSGSVMNCKYLRVWQEHLPEVLYVNQYGPTEATASCTYYVVKEAVADDTVLPIGRPFPNYHVTLLREDGMAAAPGEIGELCVSGPVLMLGYYGDPGRTGDVLIQNPLNPRYRELLYRTGDLACWNAAGDLEFHGRMDRQIKHMGHRIELGEIEATAMRIPGVTACCALYHKPKEQLYLFYTGTATAKEIVVYFRKVLPAFMAPRKLVQLEALPKLPNGKTDMQELRKTFA